MNGKFQDVLHILKEVAANLDLYKKGLMTQETFYIWAEHLNWKIDNVVTAYLEERGISEL